MRSRRRRFDYAASHVQPAEGHRLNGKRWLFEWSRLQAREQIQVFGCRVVIVRTKLLLAFTVVRVREMGVDYSRAASIVQMGTRPCRQGRDNSENGNERRRSLHSWHSISRASRRSGTGENVNPLCKPQPAARPIHLGCPYVLKQDTSARRQDPIPWCFPRGSFHFP